MRARRRVPGELVPGALGPGAGVCKSVLRRPAARARPPSARRRRRPGRRGLPRTAEPARRARRRRRSRPEPRPRARAGAPRSGRSRAGRERAPRSSRPAPRRSRPRTDSRAAIPPGRRLLSGSSSTLSSGSPATSRRAPSIRFVASIASPIPLYSRMIPSERSVRPSSRRSGWLGKTGCGITRRRSGSTSSASWSRPRSLCTTTRSKRPKSRRQSSRFAAVRRGSTSWAVNTSGLLERSSRSSSSGAESHWKWTTSAARRFSLASPTGCSSSFTGIRSRERRNTRELTG